MKKNKNIKDSDWNMIVAYVSGNMNAEEALKFELWLSESIENKTAFTKAKKIWEISENANAAEINALSAWNNVSAKNKDLIEHQPKQIFLNTSKYLLRIAAVFAIGAITWFVVKNFNSNAILKAEKSLAQVELSDNSHIDLNKGAELQYPKRFTGSTREVVLKGEAFFNIARNPEKPFIIHTAKANIKVLGTSFNVNAVSEGNIEVIVKSGTVEVTSNENMKQVVLHKDEKMKYNPASGEMTKSLNNDINYLFWKTHKLTFRETTLANVFETIEKVYNVKVLVQDAKINQCKLTATYENLDVEEIMNMIRITFGFKVTLHDNTYLFEGNSCPKEL